ncbi:DUF349 domain-containing protein [Alteromonas halophila]|uniref:DUF349 domain-containing protein n=1 Tax=Alteromonas halophila TaxID=516698 RepID=A0A918MV19_9ALTE|nr:DUF349 domain-containing protein [Alteromonas halophila]GGW77069.1 hypothetical protein GCM10007391_07480 [Alteromonas halophila]
MIFNRFFTPAYRSDNPQTRIKAIDSLAPDKPQEKTILHELAFNDASPDVTLAALHRLNSFALWQKMAAIAHTERVRREAEKQVEGILKGQIDVAISDNERRAFLTESASSALIRELLLADPSLHNDASFVVTLLTRVGESRFTQQVFHFTPNASVQDAIISQSADTDFLGRLQRKVTDSALSEKIAGRIDALVAQAEKPVALKKAVTLCLSKYQALLDKNDYADAAQRAESLEAEYQTLMADSDCLTAEDASTLRDKHAVISEQISRHCARLKPQWQAQQKAREIEQTLQHAKSQADALQREVSALYDEKLLTATAEEVGQVTDSLAAFKQALSTLSGLDDQHTHLPQLTRQWERLSDDVGSFAAQQQAGQRVLALLEDADAFLQRVQQDSPVTHEQRHQAEQFAVNWRETSQALRHLPAPWQARWKQIWSAWKTTVSAQDDAAEQQIKACRKQLNIIDSQIEKGRFRPAMRAFDKLRMTYQQLPADAQQALRKRFDNTQADIERLEGWQSYLATPRKPALLEQARELAASTPDDIQARSDAIRYLRQQWKSLGSTGDAHDDEQNAQFDGYLEAAFAPCREYYAKEDARREQAFGVRQALIENVRQLNSEEEPATLVRTLDRLRDKWHHAGQVDVKRYRKLKQQWDSAIAPHQQRIDAWQQQNREAKQALIKQAEALSQSDDVAAAARDAQQLQQHWKTIGHTGRRTESALWQQFKAANDALFAKLKAQRKSQDEAQSQQANTLLDKLSELHSQRETLPDNEMRSAIRDIERALNGLNGSLKRKVLNKMKELDTLLTRQRTQQHQREQQAKYAALQALLRNWRDGTAKDAIAASEFADLGRQWQQACESQETSAYTRAWLTTALELHCAMPSPASVSEERQAVQLALLSAKMEQGEKWNTDALVEHWLRAGPVREDEQPLAARVSEVIQAQQQKQEQQ